jgi:hypothetical protein
VRRETVAAAPPLPKPGTRLRLVRLSYNLFLLNRQQVGSPEAAVQFARSSAGVFGLTEPEVIIAVCGRVPFGYEAPAASR